MKITHLVKYFITIISSHTNIVDKWVGMGDKWRMYRNVPINKQ